MIHGDIEDCPVGEEKAGVADLELPNETVIKKKKKKSTLHVQYARPSSKIRMSRKKNVKVWKSYRACWQLQFRPDQIDQQFFYLRNLEMCQNL